MSKTNKPNFEVLTEELLNLIAYSIHGSMISEESTSKKLNLLKNSEEKLNEIEGLINKKIGDLSTSLSNYELYLKSLKSLAEGIHLP